MIQTLLRACSSCFLLRGTSRLAARADMHSIAGLGSCRGQVPASLVPRAVVQCLHLPAGALACPFCRSSFPPTLCMLFDPKSDASQLFHDPVGAPNAPKAANACRLRHFSGNFLPAESQLILTVVCQQRALHLLLQGTLTCFLVECNTLACNKAYSLAFLA